MELSEIKILSKEVLNEFRSESQRLGLTETFSSFNEQYLLGIDRFFGDLYVPLLADILNVRDKKIIKEFGVAHLFGRVFVILQDQLLDESGNLKKETRDKYLLDIPIVFQRMMMGFEKTIDSEYLNTEMERCLAAVSKHNQSEIKNHNDNIQKYSEQEITDLWKKTSLFPLPSLIFANNVIGRERADELHRITCKLVVIIQLCDDLSDIVEDLIKKNFTHPITEVLLDYNTKELTLENIRTGLLKGGVLSSILIMVLDLITEIQQEVRVVAGRESIAERYFYHLRQYVMVVQTEAVKLSFSISPKDMVGFLQKLKDASLDFPHIYKDYDNE